METITITFGDCAENHVGMQKIGTIAKNGYSLENAKNGKETELICLNDFLDEQIEEIAYMQLKHLKKYLRK
jgi:hypothetical protein